MTDSMFHARTWLVAGRRATRTKENSKLAPYLREDASELRNHGDVVLPGNVQKG